MGLKGGVMHDDIARIVQEIQEDIDEEKKEFIKKLIKNLRCYIKENNNKILDFENEITNLKKRNNIFINSLSEIYELDFESAFTVAKKIQDNLTKSLSEEDLSIYTVTTGNPTTEWV